MSVKNIIYKADLNNEKNVLSLLFSDTNFKFEKSTIFQCDGVIDKIRTNLNNDFINFLLFLNNYNEICFLKFNLEKITNLNNLNSSKMKILEKTVSNISSRKIKVNNECIYYLDKKLQSKKYFYEKIKIKLIQNSSDEIIYAGLIYQYTITTIAINMKSNYISIKNYRYSGFEIETFIFSNSEDSFTGKDLELIISVYYDKKEKEILNLHKIYLPNLETEIILNHESLMAKKDEGKKYKLFTHGRNYFLLFKYGKNLILICFDQNLKIISESEIQENFFIEYFKIFEIDKKLYLVFCSIDKFLNVYKINDQNSKMVFYNKFQIPTENLILPDYKIINFPKEIFLILNNSSLFKIDLIKNIISFVKNSENILGYCDGDWGLGIGDWGLGDWAQSPNPQSPIPNPHEYRF
jgi:hypothetical protein